MQQHRVRRYVGTLVLLAVLITALAPAGSQAHDGGYVPGLALDLAGTLQGAPFEIHVPAAWNGTLIVYADGYRDKASAPGEVEDRAPRAAPTEELEALLLDAGYALAGSAYRSNGWSVEEGLEDTRRLTHFFRSRVARPRRSILLGHSMGTLIALKNLERHPGLYDGALASCGLLGGASRTIDSGAAFGLAYDVAFGWPAAWGPFGDPVASLDFEADVVPTLVGQLSDPANFGRFEFMRLVNDVPEQDFYSGGSWLFVRMLQITEWAVDLAQRGGPNMAANSHHVYSLTADEQAYLNGLGIDAAGLLAQMNARATLEGAPEGRSYLRRNADLSGKLRRPVLTIHTTVDGIAPASHEAVYRDLVAERGAERYLVQTFTDSVGHCTFSSGQIMAAVSALDRWVTTGAAPDQSHFPEQLGFVHDFVPAPWPYARP